MGGRALALMAAVMWLAGCSSSTFACTGDEQCQSNADAGTCEPTGFCSFPDPVCPSGRRYGEHAGAGFGGQCAADPSGTESGSSGGESATASASGIGTTTAPEPTSTTSAPPTTSTTTAVTVTASATATVDTSAQTGDPATTGPDASCDDGELNGRESDVDCGGPCAGCPGGRMCGDDADCLSLACVAGICVDASSCDGEPARWNPDDAQMNIEFLEDFRTVTITLDSVNDTVRADTPLEAGGRYYWEVELVEAPSSWVEIGTADSTLPLEIGPSGADGFGLSRSGSVQGIGDSGLSYGVGDIVGVAVDVSEQRAWVHVNGAWGFGGAPEESEGFAFGYSATLYPSLTMGQGDTLRANFGNAPFVSVVPPGFSPGVCE